MALGTLLQFAILASALVTYLTVGAVYRLFFHPLSRFPGPRLAAVTTWHRGYYYTFGKGHNIQQRLEELHDRYGPVVRMEPNMLHFSEPEAFWDIYAPGSSMRKDPRFYDCFQMQHSAAGSIEVKDAKRRRDLVSGMFSRRSVLKLESVVQGIVNKFVGRMLEFPPDHHINLHLALRSVALDVITQYCFGDSMAANTLDTKEFGHPVLHSNEQRLGMFWWIIKLPFLLPLVYSIPDWLADRVFVGAKVLRGLRQDSMASIDKILADPSQLQHSVHETIFHHLLNPESSKRQGLTAKQDLIDESDSLVGAGSDTVGNSCNIGFFHILNNKHVRDRLVAELVEASPDPEHPASFDRLEKLPYLTAVLKESLRFSHGVVTPIPRQVTDANGAIIAGHAVPHGTVVSQSVLLLHSNPDIFPSPTTFSPERWLSPDAARLDAYFQPFSRGPRMCLGLTLAWCELYLIFATVFRNLDLELYDTSIEDFKSVTDRYTCHYEGRSLRVRVKGRLGAAN